MPLEIDQEIVRRNEADFKLLDDRNITGGYHTVADLPARDAIQVSLRKVGMLVYVAPPTDTVYILQSDLVTWAFFSAGNVPVVGEEVSVVPFTFSTASPLIITGVAVGDILNRSEILIETAFDGVSPTILLGTFASPGLVFSSSNTTPSVAEQYESLLLTKFDMSDFLILTINPNGSTQGSGILFYKIRRA